MPSVTVTRWLTVNGVLREITAHPDTTLLGLLLDNLKLTGTKYGCGRGICGACTVYLDGKPVQACQYVLSEIGERAITTIEGLPPETAFVLYDAWAAEQLKPCNRCQSGLIMRAADLLQRHSHPSREQITRHMAPYDCNCGAFDAMAPVVERAARALSACSV